MSTMALMVRQLAKAIRGRLLGAVAAIVMSSTALVVPSLARGASGDLDSTFGGNGRVKTVFPGQESGAESVAVSPYDNDRQIVAVGNGRHGLALARYGFHGKLDRLFSGDGKVTSAFTSASDPHAVFLD